MVIRSSSSAGMLGAVGRIKEQQLLWVSMYPRTLLGENMSIPTFFQASYFILDEGQAEFNIWGWYR